jgi:predicted RNA-binding Zn ribbon-like protein
MKDESFEWIAGHVALDFTNTVTWRRWGLARERLESYGDLLKWSEHAGSLETAVLVALRKLSRDRPRAAGAAHRDALRARVELHALFVALATGQRTPARVMASVSRRSRGVMSHLALRFLRGRVTVGWDDVLRLDRPLWPILKAAIELVSSAELGRLRLCANPDCGWVFLDQSRKGNRRWCSMRECGSRAKARAYYHRRYGGRDRQSRQSQHIKPKT